MPRLFSLRHAALFVAALFLPALATAVLAADAAPPQLDGAGNAAPLLRPETHKNVTVFKEPGRYGGWPANQGIWAWQDEVVVGFTAATFKHAENDHAVDRSKPFEKWQARSFDGGETWAIEKPEVLAPETALARATPLTESLDFMDPNFALLFQFANQNVGPSYFFASSNRAHTWKGPYTLAVEGIEQVTARTDYVVLGPRACLIFGSAAKADGKEGRAFCARTDDGGLHWKLVSLIGPEPAGYAIMPSSTRLENGDLLTTLRRFDPGQPAFLEAWLSSDLGKTWQQLDRPAPSIGGGNPPSLVHLRDGRLALVYGYRAKPYGVRARLSSDGGRTWGDELTLRDDGLTGDLGYCRSIERRDGRSVLSIYYFNGPKDEDRAIEATIWSPAPAIAQSGLAVVNRVRFLPAPKRAEAMVGGKFTGSNVSPTEGFQTLAEIKTAPPADIWTDLSFPNTTPYRWVRYEAPPGSHGNVAEIVFFQGERKLYGTGFGSPVAGAFWKGAVDSRPDSWVNSPVADGQYAGFDFGEIAALPRPALVPPAADYRQPQRVALQSATPGAVIRYTLDGTIPGPRGGLLYDQPIAVDKTTNLVAVSFQEGMAPSLPASGTYVIGEPPGPLLHTFHIGNSLTGNAMRLPTFTHTYGLKNDIQSYLIGGSLTVQLWKASQGDDHARWERAYAGVTKPLDHFTMQPRDFNVAQEAEYGQRFLDLIRQDSPEVQPWLYCEWVEMDRQRPSDQGQVPSSEMRQLFPALTWQESMSAMLLYMEEVQRTIAQTDHAGKRVRIIPTALAMGWLRTLLDEGKVPGLSPGEQSYYAAVFDDKVHVNPSGCYLVDLTWYSAFYRNSPEGKILPLGTALTGEQAALFQRLAWDVVKNYPDCGLYEEGTEPCGKPEFAAPAHPVAEVTPIRLTSATLGAWFRYTLDGTPPTRTNGYVYCGVISVRPGMTVKAIAYKSGLADSAVAEATWPEEKH